MNAVPFLWRLAGSNQPEAVRRRATRLLSDFLGVDESNLPPAKVALTREAERYYQHRVPFADPNAVTIWRWDDATSSLVRGWPGAETVNKDNKAEETVMAFAASPKRRWPSTRPTRRPRTCC